MTKTEFMYAIGQDDEEQIEILLLLSGIDEPENGDWIEIMKSWYNDAIQYARDCEARMIQ